MFIFLKLNEWIGMRSRYWADRRGVSAIEFAIVGPLFLFFIVTFLEMSLNNLIELNLFIALDKASRAIIIAQTNTSPIDTSDHFKAEICKAMSLIPSCANNDNFKIQARIYDLTNYAADLFYANSLKGALHFDWNQGQQNSPLPWCIGGPGSAIFLEAEYLAPVYATGWYKFNTTTYKNTVVRPITARRLIMREPISAAGSGSTPQC